MNTALSLAIIVGVHSFLTAASQWVGMAFLAAIPVLVGWALLKLSIKLFVIISGVGYSQRSR
jgi:hypothetical protein